MLTLRRWVGSSIALAGITMLGWVWFAAETVGYGLQLGVRVHVLAVPAMAPIIVSLATMVVGLSVGFGETSRLNNKR